MFTVSVSIIEIIFIILLSYFAASVFLEMIKEPFEVSTNIPSSEQTGNPDRIADYSNLLAVDAFFGGNQNLFVQRQTIAPESTLDLKIYGLRTSGNGKGTAILKPQGEAQKLFQVGDNVTDNVRLTSVYHDRIEIRRNGVIETIFLDKERSDRAIVNAVPKQENINQRNAKIDELLTAFDLNAYRKNNRISGFVVGDDAEQLLLTQAGLEKGDILYEVNGEELLSWERLTEVAENSNGNDFNIKFERHGVVQSISLSGLISGQF